MKSHCLYSSAPHQKLRFHCGPGLANEKIDLGRALGALIRTQIIVFSCQLIFTFNGPFSGQSLNQWQVKPGWEFLCSIRKPSKVVPPPWIIAYEGRIPRGRVDAGMPWARKTGKRMQTVSLQVCVSQCRLQERIWVTCQLFIYCSMEQLKFKVIVCPKI